MRPSKEPKQMSAFELQYCSAHKDLNDLEFLTTLKNAPFGAGRFSQIIGLNYDTINAITSKKSNISRNVKWKIKAFKKRLIL